MPIVGLRHGRITGERPVRSTSPEEIVSLITGELADDARPMETTDGDPAGRKASRSIESGVDALRPWIDPARAP